MAAVRSSRLGLVLCLGASLLLHAVVIGLLAAPNSVLASILINHTPDTQDPTRLGIEESVLESIAWIGFAKETPHNATKAETLQPELSVDAFVTSAQAAVQATSELSKAAVGVSESFLENIRELAELAAKVQKKNEETQEAQPAEPVEPTESAQQAQHSPSQPSEQAIKDDRESDATSIEITISTSELGKVIARQGLRIQTFRPIFDATTKQHELRSRRGRVTAVIRFGPDGKVVSASLKPGTQTGEATIDEPILDSVYRWQARGTQIDELPATPDAAVTVEIQILF